MKVNLPFIYNGRKLKSADEILVNETLVNFLLKI